MDSSRSSLRLSLRSRSKTFTPISTSTPKRRRINFEKFVEDDTREANSSEEENTIRYPDDGQYVSDGEGDDDDYDSPGLLAALYAPDDDIQDGDRTPPIVTTEVLPLPLVATDLPLIFLLSPPSTSILKNKKILIIFTFYFIFVNIKIRLSTMTFDSSRISTST